MANAVVTEALKARVWDKIHQCMQLIYQHYGIILSDPVIDFQLTGSIAGSAYYKEWRISLNAGLLNEHTEAFLARTVPHELAHLATERIYPEAHTISTDQKKRDLHGAGWQEIMGVIGSDPSRTHSYDTSNTAKPKTKYHYKCPFCNHAYVLGPKQHATAQRTPKRYICSKAECQAKTPIPFLVFEQCLGRVSYCQTKQINDGIIIKGPDAKFQLKMKIPTGNSKLAQCWELYHTYFDRYDRSFVIDMFINEVGCTPAGAATYYSNCKKIYESGAR